MNQNRFFHHRLETKQLTLAYDGAPVVQNLNLGIPTGKITVLVGANGCGKSTLLRGLARLLKPKSGMVYLDGKAIFQLNAKTVAKKLGMLPQSPTAPEGLTVQDLVAMGRYPYQNWLQQWSSEDEQKVKEALEITNMTELADRALDNLSGGQRQRAWIAMVLAQDTDLLLLDEPTTFLDLSHQVELLDLLYELHEQQGKTIVMILHDLNLSCRYADYLVAVQQGKIYTTGTPEQVMTEEMVRDVFNLECRIVPDPLADTPMCIPMGRKVKLSSSWGDKPPKTFS
ncbi:iron-enterobactin transporter subunit; ATP-binding component of ABC superfamily [Hyella patelloides LEGE 07179]|uniref:Iron-enterobactin transporter subunit ATP-binding component of ABC superfamily n=1 Tax=Hyella patelloides LEGE 07179 TaxID=945734 RepID=A0A563VNC5_9CYAN|nr:ABC transporter ATP-binding protein [Hyella patelloides]VEP12966.1 iron-enterobactin transporter subunit; ATP-binding component of ABC superfamily [Hyella patelloides LEGE 07179]